MLLIVTSYNWRIYLFICSLTCGIIFFVLFPPSASQVPAVVRPSSPRRDAWPHQLHANHLGVHSSAPAPCQSPRPSTPRTQPTAPTAAGPACRRRHPAATCASGSGSRRRPQYVLNPRRSSLPSEARAAALLDGDQPLAVPLCTPPHSAAPHWSVEAEGRGDG